MPKAVFSAEKVRLEANQRQFFNLPRKQLILSEYIREVKGDIASVGKMIANEMQKK
ncbi:hypothetical protein OR571_01540 [Psychrobacillus sp. NEAU-3TGS]|uniref:hypothetical protein n=1 Tax=Psychrobacillus sp. NEAU-3TGS TaxID=2995412 RepID=UPI002498CAE8|nr:hypothetical protein [Psychrobacillus sp. NEAU-3TGS]MDI2585844.1 hypothetical protein [Psychrobacillus sp. NEAU-3TGS]